MISLIISIFILFIFQSCKDLDEPSFNDLSNQESVKIVLADYNLDQVPPQIKELSNAEELEIISDRKWKVYPPVSFFEIKEVSPPFKNLPDEITTLSKLKRLRVVDLNLRELPKDFQKLENLEELDLSFNKLQISNEMGKLRALPNLRHLNVVGNLVDTIELKSWMKVNQNLKIIFKLDIHTP